MSAPSESSSREGAGSVAGILFVKLPYLITGALLLVAIGINFANVIGRYVFATPIFWTEEVLVFIVVWSVFIAMSSIAYRGGHVTMDLFYARFTRPWKKLVNGAVAGLFIACGVFVVLQSYQVVSLHIRMGAVSVAAGAPLVIPHAALLVGFALMVLAVLCRVRAYVDGTLE
jgi:TRAP-type C4-dicarboxylate transport system permease small subunit